MTQVTFQGNKVSLNGQLPSVGSQAPEVKLCDTDLKDFQLKDKKGSVVIFSIVPSLDTGVCATSARKFNQEASSLNGVTVCCVSEDLPFASGRFCQAEGIKNVVCLSDYRRENSFGKNYGVEIADGALRGLLSRAIVVIDKQGKVAYTELVNEITNEPNYSAALDAAKKCL